MNGKTDPSSSGPSPPGTVIVVAGPTASGKSEAALVLAERLGGIVINADSMQVYRDIPILTDQPGADTCARAPHRLYGTLDGADVCSAGRWRSMALGEIATAGKAGQTPIVVGGTGLYLKALITGLAPIPEIPAEVRAAARARHGQLGGEEFHRELAGRDAEMAARLAPGDSQRLIRAWEVLEATGRSLAWWQSQQGKSSWPAAPQDPQFKTILFLPPRADIYRSCDARFQRMIEGGALDEVKALGKRALDPTLPVMKALGVKDLLAHIRGEVSLDDATVRAQRRIRNYAKRQMTWFQGQMMAQMTLNTQYLESFNEKIFSYVIK